MSAVFVLLQHVAIVHIISVDCAKNYSYTGAPTLDEISVMVTGFAYENGKRIVWDDAYDERSNLKYVMLFYSMLRTSEYALYQNSSIREAFLGIGSYEIQKGSACIRIKLVFNKTALQRRKVNFQSAEFLRTIFDLFKSYANCGDLGDQIYFGIIIEIASEIDGTTYYFHPNEVFTRPEERTDYSQSQCSGSSTNNPARHIWIILLMKCTKTLL
ncbi:unnamed protein product [Dicrocoelium dendriticum]|nr:unnamed protein product [Dicrocoelium dendriticum]